MIQGKCPICSKSYKIGAIAELKTFPFCSARCRIIDLGRWAGGTYAIPQGPGEELPENADIATVPAAEDE
jgi:endogenous inhibitor of DNA gyrase (YacG/DUF329 family)